MNLSPKIKVAVLRGGPSSHYDDSLQTGNYVLSHLRHLSDKYEPLDIWISKDGEWHLSGIPYNSHDILRHTDMAWNALHGSYGEDGQVQRLLEKLQIPYTGSSAVSSILALNKDMAREKFAKHSLLVPQYVVLKKGDATDERLIEIFRTYVHPVVVRPASGRGNWGAKVVHGFKSLVDGVKDAFSHSPRVLIEEHVRGSIVTCGVIEGARGHELYTLVPMGSLRAQDKNDVEKIAKEAHRALGLRHFSESRMAITPKGKIYILDTTSLPDLHEESDWHKSLGAVGFAPHDFVDHTITLTLGK